MADTSFLSSYIKESKNEINQIKLHLSTLNDIKENNSFFRSSVEIDINQISKLSNNFSEYAQSFMDDLYNIDNQDSFIQSVIKFGEIFYSFDKNLDNNFDDFKTIFQKTFDDQNDIIDNLSQYITDLSSLSIKDLSLVRKQFIQLLSKKEKKETNLKQAFQEKFEKNLEKIIVNYLEYLDFLKNLKEIEKLAIDAESFNNLALKTFLLNTIYVLNNEIEKSKIIFNNVIKYKRLFYQNCLKKINNYIDNIQKNPKKVGNTEITKENYEEIKRKLNLFPESEEIFNFFSSKKEEMLKKKQILSTLLLFLKNILFSYEQFIKNSTEIRKKLGSNSTSRLSNFHYFLRLYDFLRNLTDLLSKKAEEFIEQIKKLISDIEIIFTELSEDIENYSNYLINFREECTKFNRSIQHAEKSNSSELIDECYKIFNVTIQNFFNSIKNILIRLSDPKKSLETLKENSFDQIAFQTKKLFDFFVGFTGLSDTLFKDVSKEEIIFCIFSPIFIGNEEKGKILIQYYSEIASQIYDNHPFHFINEPNYSLIKDEDKMNFNFDKICLNKILNQQQLILFNNQLENYQSRQRNTSNNTINDTIINFFSFLKNENETKENNYFVISKLDNNLITLNILFSTKTRFIYYPIVSQNPFSIGISDLQYSENEFCIQLISTEQGNKTIEIFKTSSTNDIANEIRIKLSKAEEEQKKALERENKTNKLVNFVYNAGLHSNEIKVEDLPKIIHTATETNMQKIKADGWLHPKFAKHYIINKKLEYINESENKTIPIPSYFIFKIIYDPNFRALLSQSNHLNFILYLQSLRNDYDNKFSLIDYNSELIPKFYSDSLENNFQKFFSGLAPENVPNIINELTQYPLKTSFNYNYYHPIPNPVFLGPKILHLDDTYNIIFVSPTCFIVEIKSQSSGFMLLDSFYTVSKYLFESELNNDMTFASTKLNAFFTIEFVKENWFKSKVESNGYQENEEYIVNFLVPNMITELSQNMELLIKNNKQLLLKPQKNNYDTKERDELINYKNKNLSLPEINYNETEKTQDSYDNNIANTENTLLNELTKPITTNKFKPVILSDFIGGNCSKLHYLFILISVLLLCLSVINIKLIYIYVLLFIILIELIKISHQNENIYRNRDN